MIIPLLLYTMIIVPHQQDLFRATIFTAPFGRSDILNYWPSCRVQRFWMHRFMRDLIINMQLGLYTMKGSPLIQVL